MPDSLKDLIGQLCDKSSPKRRLAAKRLRKLRDPRAGEELLNALRVELKNKKTWETQYQMVMAIGECGYTDALTFLESLAEVDFESSMIYVAIGDSIVRLKSQNDNDASAVLAIMNSKNEMLIDGSFRALAMLRIVPTADQVDAILRFVSHLPNTHHLRYWIAVAAAGWGGAAKVFLEQCAKSRREDIKDAAAHSLLGKYQRCNPL